MENNAKELQALRDNLQDSAEKLLQQFEADTGLCIEDIHIRRAPRHIGQRAGQIISIEIEVKL